MIDIALNRIKQFRIRLNRIGDLGILADLCSK
jgi:hypothetical protein